VRAALQLKGPIAYCKSGSTWNCVI